MDIELSLKYIAETRFFNKKPIRFDKNLEKALSHSSEINSQLHTWINEALDDRILLKSQIDLITDISSESVFSVITYKLSKEPTDSILEQIIKATTGQLSDGYGEEPWEVNLKNGIFNKKKIYIGLLGMGQTYPVKFEKKHNYTVTVLYQKVECSSELLEAVESGDFDQIVEYIKKQGNINCESKKGHSLLTHAINKSQEKIALYLIENGAEITNKNDLLIYACSSGLSQVTDFLLSNGADVNFAGLHQRTPLMWACNHEVVVKLLVNRKANVNAQDIDGKTVLGLSRNPEVVKFLLSVGADPKIKDTLGKTTSDQVEEILENTKIPELINNYKTIIELLKTN